MKLTKADLIGLSIVLAVCWMAASFIFVCFWFVGPVFDIVGIGVLVLGCSWCW